MMHHHEPASSSLLAQILHHFTRRQYRAFVAAGVGFILFSAVWLYSDSRLAADNFRLRPHDKITTEDNTNSHQTQTTGSEWRTQHPTPYASHLIPPKIWQILLPKKPSADSAVDPEQLKDTASWIAMNTDYTYTLVGQTGGDAFVQHHFADQPSIVEVYKSLPNVGMKSDLLRYLLLDIEGGVYTDIDTVALKSINVWVPPDLRDRVRLIVGVEFDRRDGGAWADIPHWLQLAQWTIAAAPGHPVFRSMVARVLQSVKELSETHGVPVDQLKPTSFEVMNSTGPAAWTDVVFQQLQQYDPALKTTKDLSFMTGPKLYGDILVLNIDGFGMGQSHSHSTHDGTIPELALMRHLFRGSWRGN